MIKVAVVTPIYKLQMKATEIFALQYGYDLLRNYQRILIAPRGLDPGHIRGLILYDRVVNFEPQWFASIPRYNRLLLSEQFYQSFSEFDYILLFQSDAFVFRDDLLAWCEKEYAYIGAPWPKGKFIRPYSFRGSSLIGNCIKGNRPQKRYVGNGGFSLRNVRLCIDLLRARRTVVKYWSYNEDMFWAFYGTSKNGNFPIPGEEEASTFALEMDAERYYFQNGGVLPFGCHGWEKYEVGFWHNMMKTIGLKVVH